MQLEYSIQMGDQVTTAYGAADCRLLNPFGDPHSPSPPPSLELWDGALGKVLERIWAARRSY
jgi:hypothetical protein